MGAGSRAPAAGVAVLGMALAGCIARPDLPVMGDVPDFELTSQTGAAVDRNTLLGHVWVADFMFTTCPGPCPRMSSQMHAIQTSTASMPDVKLVSFTVD